MSGITERSFGLIIAFLLPGFLFLWGYSYFNYEVAHWLSAYSTSAAPTVGGFLFTTLASLTIGLLVSVLRRSFVDEAIYRLTWLKRPNADQRGLSDPNRLTAFQAAVDQNYRYYQCYTHCWLVAAALFGMAVSMNVVWLRCWMWGVALVFSVVVLWVSRKELENFNARFECIMQKEAEVTDGDKADKKGG